MMPRFCLGGLLVALTFLGCSAHASDNGLTATDWQQFLGWWPGVYDNSRQIEAAIGPADDRLPHMRLYIRHVDIPSFGDNVYYAEWQDFEDPGTVRRQRIYAFENEGEYLRLNLHIFPMDESFGQRTAGAYLDVSKLRDVTPEDMYPLTGCDVYFRSHEGEFVGEMRKRRVNFPRPIPVNPSIPGLKCD